jgi:DNA helicase-2/ATP-dependent DNA helicase PcrA
MRATIDADPVARMPRGEALRVLRSDDRSAEASAVAERIAALVAGGTPPGRIAVLHRTLRTLAPYEDVLVARDLPVALAGDPALFTRPEVLDALAVLWSAVDPFRHAWLLRVLQTPMLRLSDASLALLCGEPPNPQPALFALPEGASAGDRRWDRKRDLRLGTNVVGGDRDAELSALARERLVAFRARRLRWIAWLRETDVASATRAIVEDAGLLLARPSENAATVRRRETLVGRVLELIAVYAERHPFDDLAGALSYCERLAAAESGPEVVDEREDAVAVAAVDRVLARRFDHVFVVDARAGSFPAYYVPDAFLFSPTYGMVPKEGAGAEHAARTAKFTWYEHQAKPRSLYVKEQRRLFAAALGRADVTATVSASGRPTRGIAAPEFAAEIAALLARAE